MSHKYVKNLCESNNEDELKEISQHNIVNAFDTVVVGNHPAGLNALMPAEILHQMFLGVIEYTLKGFVHLYSKKGLSRFYHYARVVCPISIHNSDQARNMYQTLFQNILLYLEWLSQPSYDIY